MAASVVMAAPDGRVSRKSRLAVSQKQKWEKMCIITYRMTDEVALLAPT